jgi:hypothetical protein
MMRLLAIASRELIHKTRAAGSPSRHFTYSSTLTFLPRRRSADSRIRRRHVFDPHTADVLGRSTKRRRHDRQQDQRQGDQQRPRSGRASHRRWVLAELWRPNSLDLHRVRERLASRWLERWTYSASGGAVDSRLRVWRSRLSQPRPRNGCFAPTSTFLLITPILTPITPIAPAMLTGEADDQ